MATVDVAIKKHEAKVIREQMTADDVENSVLEQILKDSYWGLPKDKEAKNEVISRVVTHIEKTNDYSTSDFMFIKRLTKVADLIAKENISKIGFVNEKLYEICLASIEKGEKTIPNSVGGKENLQNMIAHQHGYAAEFTKYFFDSVQKLYSKNSYYHLKQKKMFRDKMVELAKRRFIHAKKAANLSSRGVDKEYHAHAHINWGLSALEFYNSVYRPDGDIYNSNRLGRDEVAVEESYKALMQVPRALGTGMKVLEEMKEKTDFLIKINGRLGQAQRDLYLKGQRIRELRGAINNYESFIRYFEKKNGMGAAVRNKQEELLWLKPVLQGRLMGSEIRIKEDHKGLFIRIISGENHEVDLVYKPKTPLRI